MRRELLIGCGKRRDKLISVAGHREWEGLITLDINKDHKPDYVWDLYHLPLPFEDNSLDEIHAYEVLEHVGQQGNYKFFFGQFSDFWRMLKPSGVLFATVPSRESKWAWGDPSHTRILSAENLVFLHQPSYNGVGESAISDFRYIYKADFDIGFMQNELGSFQFGLKAIKPSRIGE